jgi:diguanylate cyclase (GGDEF)-like protein
MTTAEMRRELMTDALTGLHSLRWMQDYAGDFSHTIAFDADSLKWVNDNLGHESGDALLRAWGEALAAATENAARAGGDEFFAYANSVDDANAIVAKVQQLLNNAVITAETPDGEVTINGIGVSFGIGNNRRAADEKLNQHKQQREATGERAGRGEAPRGITRQSAEGQPDQDDQSERQDDQVNQDDDGLAPSTPINDFGEKLEGAKKDLWRNYQKAMSDELPADAKDITLAKHFPEPDYENLIAQGIAIRSIAAIKAMRDEVQAKPRMPGKVRRWASELTALREFANHLINGTQSLENIQSIIKKSGISSRIADRIKLYGDLGYPAFKSAKNYEVSGGWTGFKDGKPLPKESFAIKLPSGRNEYYDSWDAAIDALRAKLAVEPETTERKTKLDIYRVTKTGEVVIGKKVASRKYIDLQGGFKNWKEANEYYIANEAELLSLLEQRKEFKPERRSVNNPRVGTDYRQGENVTPEKFAAEFGFRGVQFGNYVEQDRRSRDLNNAYDALLDLADVIGIPPRAISLNGTLGLAFGARGSGGKNAAAAHYEPGRVVINLTKANGFGSLGHEWFHAMDNYLSKARGESGKFISGNPNPLRVLKGTEFVNDDRVRPELLEAFNGLIKAIRTSDYYERAAKRDNTRSKDYWSEAHELTARAFEAYLIDKFKQDGRSNDYLANIASDDGEDSSYPYPRESEQTEFTKAFDKLFEVLKTKETETGVALFSRVNTADGLTVEDVKDIIKPQVDRLKNITDIRVVQSQFEIPQLEQALSRYIKNPSSDTMKAVEDYRNNPVEGAYQNGTIYLVADSLESKERVLEVLKHEVTHLSVEQMLETAQPGLYKKLTDRITSLESNGNAYIKKIGRIVDKRQPGLSAESKAKEILALIAERNDELADMGNEVRSLWQRFVDGIKAFYKLVFDRDITDQDVRDIVAMSMRYAEGETVYLANIVNGEVVENSIEDGKLVFSKAGTSQTDTEAFKRWFGDSKVVDADGKPLVVYHGTKERFSTFDKAHLKRGFFHFATDFQTAIQYAKDGDHVISAYLKINNPISFSDLVNKYKSDDEAAIKDGYDGYFDPIDKSWVAYDSTQIKSATGNNGEFDGSNPNILFSRKTPQGNWLFRRDALGNVQLAPTGKAYDVISEITQNIANKANFGLASPELRKQIRKFKADMQKALDVAQDVAKGMNKMSVEDRALISDVVEGMVKTNVVPPAHVLNVAANIQNIMDTQTDELVKLGMLSKDAAERWRGKYLPRFYNRDKDPALSTFAKKLLRTALPIRGLGGGSLKGRGLYKEININELPDYQALGWEVRDPLWATNRQGKLELKDDSKIRDPESVMIWRDYTPKEREDMGEMRDSMFRFVMGYTAMQNDIALGRLFDGIARNQEWTRSRASEGYTKVPETEIAETGGVKKYGNLAGLYVRDDIMQHITQYEEAGDLLKYYRKALSFWKMGKTVMNPVSHLNNMVSNLSMAHFAGVSYWDTHKYVGALRDFVKNAPMIEEAKDAGLMTGDITRAELMADMPDDIKAMMNMQESSIKRSLKTTYNILTFGLTKPMSLPYRFEDDFFKYLIYRDARANGLEPEEAVDYATKYIFNYDDLPKNARLLRDAAIPFFAYTYKAVPALAYTAFNTPWRLAAPAAAIYGLNALAFGLIAGDDDDDLMERFSKGKAMEAEERKNLPPWMQGKSALGTEKSIRLGTDDVTGLPVYMDVSRFIPGGDMFDVGHGEFTTLPAPITPSSPFLTAFAALMPQVNRDMFTGKDIVDKNDTAAEAAKKRASWLIKQISPAIAPTGYHAEKLMNAGAQMADSTVEIPFLGFGDSIEYTGIGKDGLPVQGKYAVMNTLGIKAKPTDLELSADISAGQDASTARTIKSEIRQAARMLEKGAITQRAYDKIEADGMEKIERLTE